MSLNRLFSWTNLKHIRELLHPVRGMFLPLTVLIVLVQVLQLATPYVFKEILDTFVGFTPDKLGRLYWLVAATLGISLLMSLIKTARDHRIFACLLSLERSLPVLAQQKLMELPLGYHEQRDTGTMIVKVQRGTDRFVDLIANCLFEFLPTVLQCLATFAFLLILNWRIALIFLPVIPIFFWMTAWMNKRVRPLRIRRYEGYEQAGGQMAESLMNIHTVQAFAQEGREVRDHSAIREDIFRAESSEWRTIINCNFARDAIITAGRIAVLLFAIRLVVGSNITIGSLVFFLSVSEQAYYSLYRISRLFDRGAEWAEAVKRLTTLLHEAPEVVEHPDARPFGELTGEIAFEDVSFTYGAKKETLTNVKLHIPPGMTVALVGPSGCGKTTMVKLLFRHYDPTAGVIRLDGKNVRDTTLASFRSQMAIVPQEVEIFNRTIRENVAYAKPDATDEEIVRAAQLANAHDFILSLPKGYDTVVGERGLKLSGGQRQRVGIARALLPNPKILVFDEATSNLDSESEALIQDALERIRAGRTTILIAHRLSTIRHADRIVVFKHGRIIEQGTHDELVQTKGVYSRLHELQTRGDRLRPALDAIA